MKDIEPVEEFAKFLRLNSMNNFSFKSNNYLDQIWLDAERSYDFNRFSHNSLESNETKNLSPQLNKSRSIFSCSTESLRSSDSVDSSSSTDSFEKIRSQSLSSYEFNSRTLVPEKRGFNSFSARPYEQKINILLDQFLNECGLNEKML